MSREISNEKDRIYSMLYGQGKTLKQWAKEHEFSYQTTIRVVNGISRANRGESLQIALKLGLKTIGEQND